jgi:hypothetical protein
VVAIRGSMRTRQFRNARISAVAANIRFAVWTLSSFDSIEKLLDRSFALGSSDFCHRIQQIGILLKLSQQILEIRAIVLGLFQRLLGLFGLALGSGLCQRFGQDRSLERFGALGLTTSQRLLAHQVASVRLFELDGLERLARQKEAQLGDAHFTKGASDSESVAEEAHRLEKPKELREEYRMIHRNHQFQVAQMARAMLIDLITSCTSRVHIGNTLQVEPINTHRESHTQREQESKRAREHEYQALDNRVWI